MSELQKICCGPNNNNCGCVQYSNQYPYLAPCECNNSERLGLGFNCKYGEIPYFGVLKGADPSFDQLLDPMCGFKLDDGETDVSKCPPPPPESGPVVIKDIPNFGTVCALSCHDIPGPSGPDAPLYSNCPHSRPPVPRPADPRPTQVENFNLQSRGDPNVPIWRPGYMQCSGGSDSSGRPLPKSCQYSSGFSQPNELMGLIRTGSYLNPANAEAGRAPPCVPGGNNESKVQECVSCVDQHWGKDCKNSKGISCDFLNQTTPHVTETMVGNFCKYGMRGQ